MILICFDGNMRIQSLCVFLIFKHQYPYNIHRIPDIGNFRQSANLKIKIHLSQERERETCTGIDVCRELLVQTASTQFLNLRCSIMPARPPISMGMCPDRVVDFGPFGKLI